MTRTARQAGDAGSTRTPGIISSVQTSISDQNVRYYLCHNKSASNVGQILLVTNRTLQTRRRYCNLKYSAWIAKQVA